LRSQLRIEFIKLETKDHFVNGIEMQGSIAIFPGERLKKQIFHE
jgi:sRNA-binding regulator protein Hfq